MVVDSWLVRFAAWALALTVVGLAATTYPYVAAGLGLAIGALFAWMWFGNRQRSQVQRERSKTFAAALDGDASGAAEATGWCCVGRAASGGEAPWTVRWRVLHWSERADTSAAGDGVDTGAQAPAVLVPTNRLLEGVQVEVPCAVVGEIVWSARNKPVLPDEALLMRLTGAEEVRRQIAALTTFNAPFDATLRLTKGALTWSSVVTSRTDAAGLRTVLAGVVALARGLEAA